MSKINIDIKKTNVKLNKPTPNKPTPNKPTPNKPTPNKPTPNNPTPNKPTPNKPNIQNIQTLVLDAGGMWGLGIIGALQYLKNKQNFKLNAVEHFIGTSIGSIINTLIYVGYSIDEIENIFLNKFNLKNMFNLNGLFSFFSIASNLLLEWGLLSGDNLEKWFDKFLQKKTHKTNITFREANKMFPNKKISIIGTNLTDNNIVIFGNITSPNMSLAKAITISIAIPFGITPQIINNKYYVDGNFFLGYGMGLVNRPSYYLNRKYFCDKFMTRNNRDKLIKYFNSIPKDKIIGIKFNRDKLKNKVTGIVNYMLAITTCIIVYESKLKNFPNTILLDMSKYDPLNFNMNIKNRKKAIKFAYDQTKLYFTN